MASLGVFTKNPSLALLAVELKGKCVVYVIKHLEKDFLLSEFGQELQEKATVANEDEDASVEEKDWIQQMDRFLLFGEAQNGQRILDTIIANAKLNVEEKEILAQWRERAFSSLFEMKEVAMDTVRAMDVLAEVNYEIDFHDPVKGQEAATRMPVGSFVQTNILPVKDRWFFSGMQTVLPAESEPFIFQTYVSKASARQAFRNNPEKLQQALETQKKYYQVFVDTFAADEVIVPIEQAQKKLQEYYDNLSAGFGKPGDKTIVPELPEDFQEAETIGIVMHEQEGQHELRDYGEFVNIFKTGSLSKKSREFIMEYLEDESVPAFLFQRMQERYPGNFHKVLLETTARVDRRLYPVDDVDRLMDIFKPGWRETYPAVIPLNQRFEKYYYRLGRNDPCYCDSGKKFKKCHGK